MTSSTSTDDTEEILAGELLGTIADLNLNADCGIEGFLLGRVCANKKCYKSGIFQTWDNYYFKGQRRTSRCRTCISNDRAIAYKKKAHVGKQERKIIKQVIEVKLNGDVAESKCEAGDSDSLSQLLNSFFLSAILSIEEDSWS